MTIPCAMVRITPEQAAAAACAEHPDLITRISWLIVPKLRRETRLLQLSLFYCKYYSNHQRYWQQFGRYRRHIPASSSLTGVSPPASSSLCCTACIRLLCCYYF